MRTRSQLSLLLTALLIAACTPIVAQENTPATIAGCAVTLPTETAFVPPAPWPSQPPDADRYWYGTDGLWTALPKNGTWAQLARWEKFWWWSAEFDVHQDDTPDLTVTAQRLDGDAPQYHVTEATNGYHESFHWAMLIGAELPTPGCWHFTGTYKDHTLQFTLWVPEE